MTPKTTFGLTFKHNNVSKFAHIPNVFKKSLGMLKSECIPNVLKSQRICAIKGLDLKSVPTYLSHRLMEQIQPLMGVEPPMMVGASPSMMVVRPQAEDIKIRLPAIQDSENIKYLGEITPCIDSNKTIKLGRIPPSVDSDKTINLAPYPLMDRAYPQIEEKVYPQTEVGRFPPMAEKSFTPMMEAPFTPLGEMSVNKTIANLCSSYYPSRALSKILKLALVGYQSLAHTVRLLDFFCMRNTSMLSHIIMVKLEGDTFECAGDLESQSTNPFQLCHPHLVVNGKAPDNSLGVHNHA